MLTKKLGAFGDGGTRERARIRSAVRRGEKVERNEDCEEESSLGDLVLEGEEADWERDGRGMDPSAG